MVQNSASFETLLTTPLLRTTYLRSELYLCRSPLGGGVFLDLLLINSAVKCSVSFSICTRAQWRNRDVANRSTSPNWCDITCLTISCVGLQTKKCKTILSTAQWCLRMQKYFNCQAKRVFTSRIVREIHIIMWICNVNLLCTSNITRIQSRNELNFLVSSHLSTWSSANIVVGKIIAPLDGKVIAHE